MKKLIIILIILSCLPALVVAGGTSNLQALVNQVKLLISTGNTDKVTELIYSDVEKTSVANFKAMLATYKDAEGLEIYAVPKNDQAKVKSLKGLNPIPSTFLTVDERVKKYKAVGRTFKVVPLGELVISGKRLGVNSKKSVTSVFYGIYDGKYVITFAKKR